MSNQSRPRNPRRLVAAQLATMRDNIKVLRGRWDSSSIGQVFDPGNGAARYTGHWRKRLPHEYPENQADAWDNLARWAAHLASQAETLRAFAREREAELRAQAASEMAEVTAERMKAES